MYTPEGRQEDAGYMREAMDQRTIHAIHAEHSLDIRCVFVGWDVANTHGDVELSILVVQLMTSKSTSSVFQTPVPYTRPLPFRPYSTFLDPSQQSQLKRLLLRCLHGTRRCRLQVYRLGRHGRYGISMKRSDLQCFWAKECVNNSNLSLPNFPKTT